MLVDIAQIETFKQTVLDEIDAELSAEDGAERWTFGGNRTGNTRVYLGDAKRVIEWTIDRLIADLTAPVSDE